MLPHKHVRPIISTDIHDRSASATPSPESSQHDEIMPRVHTVGGGMRTREVLITSPARACLTDRIRLRHDDDFSALYGQFTSLQPVQAFGREILRCDLIA